MKIVNRRRRQFTRNIDYGLPWTSRRLTERRVGTRVTFHLHL